MDIATTKRPVKQQDQFLTVADNSVSWIQRNRQIAILSAVVAFVVLIAIVIAISIFQHRTAEAETAFGDAMQTYGTPLVNSGQPVPPGLKTFPDAGTRARAANAQFLSVANRFGMTKPGKLARYFAGVTYMEAGQNAAAEDTLKKVASSWNSDDAALGQFALSQLYESTGRSTEAANLLTKLGNGSATTVPAGLAKLQLAQLYSAEGRTEDARKIYALLKDKDKNAKGQPGVIGEIATEKLNPTAAPAGLGAGAQ